jgi:hypothetical protein
VRIIDIARDLVRLSGRDPDSVPVKFIGLRKGEKMHEELFYDEEAAQPTAVDKVMRVESQAVPEHIREDIHGLLSMARRLEPTELGQALHAYLHANVESDEGLWGVVETGGLASEKLGTRPVVIVPVHADAQGAGSGHQAGASGLAAEEAGAGRGIRAASVRAHSRSGITPLAYVEDDAGNGPTGHWSGSSET